METPQKTQGVLAAIDLNSVVVGSNHQINKARLSFTKQPQSPMEKSSVASFKKPSAFAFMLDKENADSGNLDVENSVNAAVTPNGDLSTKPVALQNLKRLNKALRSKLKEIEVEMEDKLESVDQELLSKAQEVVMMRAEIDTKKQEMARMSEESAAMLNQARMEMQAAETEYRGRLASAENQIQTLQTLVQVLESEKASLLENIHNMESNNKSLNDELADVQERRAQLKYLNQELLEHLKEAQDEKQALIQERDNTMAAMQARIEDSLQQLEKSQIYAAQQATQISQLEAQLQQMAMSVDNEKRNVAQRDAAIHELNDIQIRLEQEVESRDKAVRNLEVERDEQQKMTQLVLLEKDVLDREWAYRHEDLKEVNRLLVHDIAKGREQINGLNDRNSGLEAMIELREQSIQALQAKYDSLQQEHEQLKIQLDECEDRRGALKGLNNELVDRLHNLQELCDQKQIELSELKSVLDTLSREHEQLKAEHHILAAAFIKCKDQFELARCDLEDISKQKAESEEENEALKEQIAEKTLKLSAMLMTMQNMNAYTAKLEVQISEASQNEARLMQELGHMQKQMKSSAEQAEAEREALMNSVVSSQSALTNAKDHIEQLYQRFGELEQEQEESQRLLVVVRATLDSRTAELDESKKDSARLVKDLDDIRKLSDTQLQEARAEIKKLQREKKQAESLLNQSQQILSLLQAGISARKVEGDSKKSRRAGGNSSSAASSWMQRAVQLAAPNYSSLEVYSEESAAADNYTEEQEMHQGYDSEDNSSACITVETSMANVSRRTLVTARGQGQTTSSVQAICIESSAESAGVVRRSAEFVRRIVTGTAGRTSSMSSSSSSSSRDY